MFSLLLLQRYTDVYDIWMEFLQNYAAVLLPISSSIR